MFRRARHPGFRLVLPELELFGPHPDRQVFLDGASDGEIGRLGNGEDADCEKRLHKFQDGSLGHLGLGLLYRGGGVGIFAIRAPS